MRKYDTTFIIDGTLNDGERLALIERFAGVLKRQGGEIEQIVRWGLRPLAYGINKRTHGYYVIFYYQANPSIIASFERELRLNENVLRYMTLLFDGKHPDYIRDEGASGAAIVIPELPPEEEIAEETLSPIEEDAAAEEPVETESETEPLELDVEMENESVDEKETEE